MIQMHLFSSEDGIYPYRSLITVPIGRTGVSPSWTSGRADRVRAVGSPKSFDTTNDHQRSLRPEGPLSPSFREAANRVVVEEEESPAVLLVGCNLTIEQIRGCSLWLRGFPNTTASHC